MYRSAIGRAVEPFFERPFSRPLDRLYIKHGGQPLGTFARYLSGGDVAMLADLPELAPLHARTTNAVHIGPCLWEPPSTLAGPELDLGSGDQPLVYFSLGSSVFPDELVSPTVAGLLGNGFRVLLQCGHRDVRGLPADDRLIVRAFVNNRQAMRRASVAITHGGVSTSYEAILEGSPFIALPSFTDQQWNTDVFVAAGVAAMVSPQAGGASAVIHRVQRMHEDEQPRGAAESLATSIRRFDASVAVNLALDTALGHSSAHVERRRSA